MSSIDRRGDALVLNECGGCGAGEVVDREFDNGGLRTPFTSVRRCLANFCYLPVAALGGACQKGLSLGNL